jgi:hypothetical protein
VVFTHDPIGGRRDLMRRPFAVKPVSAQFASSLDHKGAKSKSSGTPLMVLRIADSFRYE